MSKQKPIKYVEIFSGKHILSKQVINIQHLLISQMYLGISLTNYDITV